MNAVAPSLGIVHTGQAGPVDRAIGRTQVAGSQQQDMQ